MRWCGCICSELPPVWLLTVRAAAGWARAGGSVRGGGGAARGCLHLAAAARGLCRPRHRHLDSAGALAHAQGEAVMRPALCHRMWPRKHCLIVYTCTGADVCARTQVLTASQCCPAGDLCRGLAQRGALRPLLGAGAAAAHDADAPVQCRARLCRQVRQLRCCVPTAWLRGRGTCCSEAACAWSLLTAAAPVQACPPRWPPGRPPPPGGPHPVRQRVPHPVQQRLGLLPGQDAPADHHVGHQCGWGGCV